MIHDELEPQVGTREITRAIDRGPRQLYNLIKAGRFPPPDVPGGSGAPNRWLLSTARRGIEMLNRKDQAA